MLNQQRAISSRRPVKHKQTAESTSLLSCTSQDVTKDSVFFPEDTTWTVGSALSLLQTASSTLDKVQLLPITLTDQVTLQTLIRRSTKPILLSLKNITAKHPTYTITSVFLQCYNFLAGLPVRNY